jgi:hypothetical protein
VSGQEAAARERALFPAAQVVWPEFVFGRLAPVVDGLFAGIAADTCVGAGPLLRGILGRALDEGFSIEFEAIEFLPQIARVCREGVAG